MRYLAENIVSVLLELNVINTQELDSLLRKIAARIKSKVMRDWFLRVLRYFVINMDQLADSPVELPHSFTKYLAFKEPGKMHEPGAATGLYRRGIEQEIAGAYGDYDPSKVYKQDVPDILPPTRAPEWAKKAQGRGDKLFYFKRPTSQTEFVQRLENVADYLNSLPEDSALVKRLKGMKVNDAQGFTAVWSAAQDWASDVEMKPWLFMKNVPSPKVYGSWKLIPVAGHGPEQIKMAARLGHNTAWCVKVAHHAKHYLEQGPLYFVLQNGVPRVLVHPPSNQANQTLGCHVGHNVEDQPPITPEIAKEIAPLFVGINIEKGSRWSGRGLENLQQAVAAVTPEELEQVEDASVEGAVKKRRGREKEGPLPPWDEPERPRERGYRPQDWE